MGARIDQFCEDLRQKLTIADGGLDGLKAKINGKAVHVEQDVQSHLDRVRKRVEQAAPGSPLLRPTSRSGPTRRRLPPATRSPNGRRNAN